MPEPMPKSSAISVLAALYGNSVLRLSVSPKEKHELLPECFIREEAHTKENFKPLHLSADPEGMLQASFRKIKIYYKPPTGRFQVKLGEKASLAGDIQTGRFDDPGFHLHLSPKDRIFGFGSATGNFLKNNSNFRLLNLDTLLFTIPKSNYSSFPFFWLQREGEFFAILLNSSYPFDINIAQELPNSDLQSTLSFRPICDPPLEFDLIFFHASPAEILEQYTKLTGRPFLPPLWSLGLHQSRWSYKTAERVYEIANTYRELDLPCDAIHLDIHYMDRYRVFTWNRRNFPDPKLLHEKLRKLNFRSVAIIDPGVAMDESYSVYQEGLQKRVFCRTSQGEFYAGKVWPGKTVFPDFSSPEVQKWWAEKHETLFSAGVSGIWNDMNDPVLKMGKNYDPLKEDIVHQQGSHCRLRNLYANREAEASKLAFELFRKKERPFILTRSATCGIQRHAALWTGDNQSTWKHLQRNLNDIINLGLSGVPFCGADVGGFAGNLPLPGMLKGFKIRRNRELFSRWIELGSLMPFFRIHSAIFTFQQDPWSFGTEVLEICRKHIRRRYRLLPYIYTLFCDSAKTGSPIVRPLFYEYPRWASEVWKAEAGLVETQFLLGESLLAAPILEAGQQERRVLLPPGEWYEYESGHKYTGDQILELEVYPGYYPLFVKAGTALPVWPTVLSTDEGLASPLVWEIYPAPKIQGRAILDDGLSPRPTDSGYIEITISGKRSHSGDMQLQQEVTIPKNNLSDKKVCLRTPEGYRALSKKSKPRPSSKKKSSKKKTRNQKKGHYIEGRLADTRSEDRRYTMYEFDLSCENIELEFPYRSGHF